MADTRISQLLNIQRRYLRSAHLQRDFQDPAALDGYIVTPTIKANFDRIRRGTNPGSGQRAWRITGDYGSGKSSFALLLANLFAGRDSDQISQIRRTLDITKTKTRQAPFLPVLITGSREPLAHALLQALFQALQLSFEQRVKPPVISRLRSALAKAASEVADTEALALISEANSELIASGKSSGLLIIIDELGKFLEFAALHPERQDVYFLQQLAELSTRSGPEPIFTIGLLHQGFNAYAHQLSQSVQKEWEKVAGRFDELLFDQPLDQVAHLISAALNISDIPRGTGSRAREAMQSAATLGWYGLDAGVSALTEIAPALYPLHPTVVPVLVRLFSRFGQNERSLFSFLLSNEPFGLQDFASQEAGPGTFYRIHHLYDYAAANFGHHLSIQTYRNHWNHIDSLIRSFPAKTDTETAILKTVGLLNLLNTPSLLPSADAICLALADPPSSQNETVQKAIQRLHKERHVLYARGATGGYFLWSHTSIDLDAAYEEAKRVVGTQCRVATRIKERLEARPIVARRHYIQTGNLRHFNVLYCGIGELEKVANDPCTNCDGRVVIPLCETLEEVNAATAFARSFTKRPDTLIGITQPLSSLSGLLQEAERWTWIQKNTLELKDDRYAAEEVARQVAHATQTLEKRVQHYAGLGQDLRPGENGITWFHRGKDREITSAANLLAYLSRLCKELYPEAPEIHNELINRRSPSSAANSARLRLIERMLVSADKEFLGMDRSKKPPEMSMYRSLLLRTKLHREVDGVWTLQAPAEEDPCNLKPGMSHILRMLEAKADSRVPVETIFDELREPPYGIRNGVLPILLLVVLLERQHEIALYEDGTFLSQIHSEEIQRLTKAPQDFELQLCRVQGFRRELFDQVACMLGQGETSCPKVQLLRVIRPLCVFVAELPEYTRITTSEQLSKRAQQVRDTILRAKEPGTLLFTDLPAVLRDHDVPEPPSATQLVARLKTDLDELGKFYTQLKNRIRGKILKAFDAKATTAFQPFRDSLADRCQNLLLHIRDIELRAFCLRLLANHLSEPEWLESVASYVTNIPPARWRDQDEAAFQEKLELLVNKINRVESINIELGRLTAQATAFRISITARDGKERDDLVHLDPSEEQQAEALAKTITGQLSKNARVAKTALARVMWKLLPAKE